jgi:hypothetical protein
MKSKHASDFYKDRDNQIEAIENLFESVKIPVGNLRNILFLTNRLNSLNLSGQKPL